MFVRGAAHVRGGGAGDRVPGAGLVVIPAHRARSNHAEVARAIGIDVIAGRLGEGAALPGDAELSARFGVSRTVLREAVKTLAAKGLLTARPRVGTRVRERAAWNMFDPDVLAWHLDAGVDARFLRDLAEIRLAVEPRAAELAARQRSEADLTALRAAAAAMRRHPSDSDAFADADLALHLGVAAASGNPFMRSIGAVIEAALRASFLLSAPVADAERAATLSAHARIVEAVAARDAPGAARAMTEVILNGLRRHGAAGGAGIDAADAAHPSLVPSRAASAAAPDRLARGREAKLDADAERSAR